LRKRIKEPPQIFAVRKEQRFPGYINEIITVKVGDTLTIMIVLDRIKGSLISLSHEVIDGGMRVFQYFEDWFAEWRPEHLPYISPYLGALKEVAESYKGYTRDAVERTITTAKTLAGA